MHPMTSLQDLFLRFFSQMPPALASQPRGRAGERGRTAMPGPPGDFLVEGMLEGGLGGVSEG